MFRAKMVPVGGGVREAKRAAGTVGRIGGSAASGAVGVLACLIAACTGGVSGTAGGGGGGVSPGTGGSTSGTGSTAGGTGDVNGSGSTTGSTGGGTATGTGSSTGAGGAGAGTGGAGFTTPLSSFAAVRKVKNLLTGLAPTDAEIAGAATSAGLKSLIDGWIATPQFEAKMLLFFGNTFQQTSLAKLDFEFQLRKRPGAFDLPYDIFGDDGFPMLFRNMKESFARTCLQLIAEGRPFNEVLTTTRFMMTTALKSLYLQIEMPYDIHTANFKFNHGTRPPIADTLNPASPNYLTFGYVAPKTATGRVFGGTCAGDSTKVSSYPGNTYLFQILLGSIPRDSTNNSAGSTALGCMEHAAQPYFTATDLSDWQMVSIVNTGTPLRSFDLPAIRASGAQLSSRLPRVSFFTTPAFLAVWNTNDSNQHRVTANQALLAALGQGFTNATTAFPTPPSAIGLDGAHAVANSTCIFCHRSLDPMKQFWQNAFDFNDQVQAKPGTMASFGFGDVTQNGASLIDFGKFVGMVTDTQVTGQPVNRFALGMTQKLCFFANSARCEETDPEMRRIALAFQSGSYDFKTLIRELFSSPLVTSMSSTATSAQDGITISISRRDQLCGALSNRLAKTDLCEIAMPTPTDVSSATGKLAGALPADAFSRGSELPVTAPDPNLFYRAASELVCEAVAKAVVDAPAGTVYTSTAVATVIPDMVQKVMGLPPSDPHYAAAVKVLMDHYTAATTTGKATATNALRSVFSAACQSPSSLSFGI